jgi:Tfp pilus assembly protein PilX
MHRKHLNRYRAQAMLRTAPALRNEAGISMIIMLGIMLVTSLLVVAAFTSANGEVHIASTDTEQKKAYYAAEAGVEDYEYHLTQDGDYLDYCVSPSPANNALNQYYKSNETEVIPSSELSTVEVPSVEGKSSEEKYAIQLIPAASAPSGDKKCDPTRLVESMVEESGSATGTFRIMSTGFAGKAKASIVATFRNANFVSYVWYTMYEVGDPVVDGAGSSQSESYWDECSNFYEQREKLAAKQCQSLNNFFGTGESVNGPIHVEDHGGVCGEPTFGRTAADRIEFGNGGKKESSPYSTESAGGCGGANPKFKGTLIPFKEVPSLPPPPGDEELIHVVEEKYHFYGKTEIILENKVMTIRKFSLNSQGNTVVTETKEVPFPENGVIYVSDGTGTGSCEKYSPFGPKPSYTQDTECGNVYVHGKYEDSLTIAAQNDVVINGSITTPTSPEDTPGAVPTTNALLGLIANNFVRIYHPLTGTRGVKYTECGTSADQTSGTEPDLKNPLIYAALLAVRHAVIVDNFDCGSPTPLEHLNLYGALAGTYSNGLTGVLSGTTLQHGYSWDAQYDNRLQVEEPPHFLNPIQAAWYIQRQTLAGAP